MNRIVAMTVAASTMLLGCSLPQPARDQPISDQVSIDMGTPVPPVIIYRRRHRADGIGYHLLTNDPNERPRGWDSDGEVFYCWNAGEPNTVELHRWRKRTGGHIYTVGSQTSWARGKSTEYSDEGALCYLKTAGGSASGLVPLVRFDKKNDLPLITTWPCEGEAFNYKMIVGALGHVMRSPHSTKPETCETIPGGQPTPPPPTNCKNEVDFGHRWIGSYHYVDYKNCSPYVQQCTMKHSFSYIDIGVQRTKNHQHTGDVPRASIGRFSTTQGPYVYPKDVGEPTFSCRRK